MLTLYGDPAGQNSFLWLCLYPPVYELSVNPARQTNFAQRLNSFTLTRLGPDTGRGLSS